jgi:membrane fusion protein (multidrug efflux system)
MKLKSLLWGIFLLVLLALIGYRVYTNQQKSQANLPKNAPKPVIPVQGFIAKFQPFDQSIQINGTLEANEMVDLRTEVSGIVDQIYFQEGQKVNKGQLLLKVNDRDLRAQLAQAVSRETLTKENERRAKLLLQKEAISQEEYDITYSEWITSKSQIDFIQAQLAKTKVVAPFSGTIGLRKISKGAYLTPTTSIGNLVDNIKIKVSFSIPEKYANQLNINTEITFSNKAQSKDFTAKVYAIEPMVDANTRTLQIRAICNQPDRSLIPGTFVQIQLPLQDIPNAILVPTEAIIPIQNGKKLFLVKNGVAQDQIVETINRTDKEVIVVSGIKEKDTILISGVMSLRNGSPVQVKIVR